MAMKHLGETLDIHCGGVDNIFPHHENEIAQSEAVTAKPFARFWIHGEHLLVEDEKMSKSKGNFYTLRDLLDKGYERAGHSLSAAFGAVPQAAEFHHGGSGAGAAFAGSHQGIPVPAEARPSWPPGAVAQN